MEYMFSISFRKQCDEKKQNNLSTLCVTWHIGISEFDLSDDEQHCQL